ncbi:hypothetical protein [Baekduia sp. Peel2402]|uniref:hypothetical protein n=1 Tax=Baekduia sp. Peel2402 TaxID=3458296 RepID=UPI00403E64C4
MLRLVPADRSAPERDVLAYDLRPHDLVARPQRPGELTTLVVVDLDDAARAHISSSAHEAGVPAALWLTVALEAQRSLRQAVALVRGDEADLATALDDAAGPSAMSATGDRRSPALAQLHSYAAALRAGAVLAGASPVGTSLPLSPALHVAAAWAVDAQRHGLTVSAWAADCTSTLPAGRLSWEAASASQAQTLAEWVLAQAMRRARSASTSAHTPARG